jgi:hypothetical protein
MFFLIECFLAFLGGDSLDIFLEGGGCNKLSLKPT